MTIVVFLVSLLGSMAIGIPVAFALIFCGLAIMVHSGQFNAQIVTQNMINGADTFTLLAIPFFILAGELMNTGGLSRRIIDFAIACVGHIRGGLGIVAIIAAVILAALSGSAAADSAALASILIPMMREAGYNVPRSAGLIAAGGIIAPVIPPSVAFIIFGVAANVSITQLFMAGIFPGLMMAVTLLVTWMIVAAQGQRRGAAAPAGERAAAAHLPRRLGAGHARDHPGRHPLRRLHPDRGGGGRGGLLVLRRLLHLPRTEVRATSTACCCGAAKTTSVVMFLVAAALVSAWLITSANIPNEIGGLIEPLIDRPRLLMLVIMLLVLLVGTALDLAPTILILTPVLMPIVKEAGIDPVYFGVVFVMNNCIGLLTPPVGVVLNVVGSVAKVPLGQVIVGVWPFLLAQTILLLLLVLFPAARARPAGMALLKPEDFREDQMKRLLLSTAAAAVALAAAVRRSPSSRSGPSASPTASTRITPSATASRR